MYDITSSLFISGLYDGLWAFVHYLYVKAVLWIVHRSLLDHCYVYFRSCRICFGKEGILYSFLRRRNTLQWLKF